MDPRIRRLMIARLISDAGTYGAIFVGIWGKATFRLHASPREMAVLAAVNGIFGIAGSLTAGVLVDRLDPKRVLIAAELIVVPSVLALMIPETIWPFIATTTVASFAGGLIMASVASFAPYLTEGAGLTRGNVAIEVASSLAMVLGPAVAGAVAKLWSIDSVFIFDVTTSVVAVALLARIAVRSLPKGERTGAFSEAREGIAFAARHAPVRLYLAAGAFVWMTFGAFSALEALFYREVLHSGPAMIGWILSLFGVALFAGALAVDRVPKRWLTARGALVLVVVIGLGEMTYVATSNLAIVIAGDTIWGIAMGAMWPMLRTLIQQSTPDHLVGRVMGSSVTANRAMQLVALSVVGSVAAGFGVQRVLVGAGAALIIIAVALAPEATRVDRSVSAVPAGPVADPAIAEPASRGVL